MVLFRWRGEWCVPLAPPCCHPTCCLMCLVSFCLPALAHCIVARMRDFMLHTNSVRLSVGAPGVVDGSVSARPLLCGATIGGGFVRGEYAQERQ